MNLIHILRPYSWIRFNIILPSTPRALFHAGLSRLSGVIFSVIAIRPKVRGIKPGRGNGFLRWIKIRSTPSFGGDVEPEVPCPKILRRVNNYSQV
jgi:hypothetical protein